MNTFTVRVARDFSRFPAGRYKSDGPYPGEVCREKVFVPALRTHDFVRIELDGTRGYGSSFLEEAFGGLVRHSGFSEAELQKKLVVVTSDTARRDEVWTYIREAEDARNNSSGSAGSAARFRA